MIFRRSIVAELTSTASAVFTVLFSILFSVGLVRILGQAAGGRVDNQAVFQLLALTALTWLPVVLTLTLFISVLMTLSRAYRDSEMVVWFASGQSLLSWLGPVMRFAWPIVIAVALLSMFVTPWATNQVEDLRERFTKRDDVSRVAPGRFIESGGADRVFFVESVDFESSQVRNVFVSMRSQGRDGVIVASKGLVEVAPNGDRYLVLEQGRRYEGRPGSAEYRTMEFERYSLRLESRPDRPLGERSAKTQARCGSCLPNRRHSPGRDPVAHRHSGIGTGRHLAGHAARLYEPACRPVVQPDHRGAGVRHLSERAQHRAGMGAAGASRLRRGRLGRACRRAALRRARCSRGVSTCNGGGRGD